MPDLIIIDGGKGQLSSVKEVVDLYPKVKADLISLAEREGKKKKKNFCSSGSITCCSVVSHICL